MFGDIFNTCSLLLHWCLAPCKSVTNYGQLTEHKSYYVEIDRTQIDYPELIMALQQS